mmetsp:Transcript_7624/g.15815  ORF Transcript_7624/g.15815 Transcript_7624/m.15815 type:complete len:467 (+) Transcript_7624:1040-2440(+)
MVFESTTSSFQDAASSARDRLSSNLGYNFKDSVESLLKVMFAPCAGVATSSSGCDSQEHNPNANATATKMDFHIGGVPKSEMGGPSHSFVARNPPPASANGPSNRGPPPSWEPSVPFEVRTRTRSDLSQTEKAPRAATVTPTNLSQPRRHPDDFHPSPAIRPNTPSTPRQRKRADALTKLRRLGAQHQLASGVHGESLADTARPVSPELPRLPPREEGLAHASETYDAVDFDDGISAISAHTLEEMERRGLIHPPPTNAAGASDSRIRKSDPRRGVGTVSRIDETEESDTFDRDAGNNPFRATGTRPKLVPAATGPRPPPLQLSRIHSAHTRATAATEDTDGELWMAEEARYWETLAQDDGKESREAAKSRGNGRVARRTMRPSVEERARRLRELSRSRSRSDGTGSSNKSSTSLRSHPHDTVPVFASDVAHAKSNKSKSKRVSPRSFVPGSFEEGVFPSLDYGEI